MDFGALGDYFEVAVAKNLSGTDVDRMVSHGHELGGFNRFRYFLGEDDRKGLPATYIYIDDTSEPVVKDSWTSWYDSRRGKPHRSAEYRLYYPDAAPVLMSRPGDLAVVAMTTGGRLMFLFAKAGSMREKDVMYLFGVGSSDHFVHSRSLDRRVDAFGEEILRIMGIDVFEPRSLDASITDMIDRWPDRLPPGREFASFARHVAGIDPSDDPDVAIMEYYNTQTALFMAYEGYEMESRLGGLVRDVSDPDYGAILSASMSIFQRRKSAAGHALEYHLQAIFDARGIMYKPQARTEGRERPDFVFPSEEAYHDPGFPSAGLTLLGAKTTAKDRWRQVLQEGDRVATKHLVTLEPSISHDQTRDMRMRGLQLVVPREVKATYLRAQQGWLWTLSDFCAHVEELQYAYC